MKGCPVCGSPFRGEPSCPRCGTDLTDLMRIIVRSRRLREEGRKILAEGPPARAVSLLEESRHLLAEAETGRLLDLARAMARLEAASHRAAVSRRLAAARQEVEDAIRLHEGDQAGEV